MEPKTLASSNQSMTPGSAGWSAAVDESVLASAREALAATQAPGSTLITGVINGAATAARNGTNGHAGVIGSGHAATTATWPTLVPHANGGIVRVVPAYEAPAESGFYLRIGKRLLDVVGASVGLILASPLLLLAAILIKLESRGPVIYRSIRIGRGARPFHFYKLRSMMDGAEQHRHTLSHLNETDGPVFKMAADPRVTRVGRLLRVSSLDEVPQLWNVLIGEMTLVGPRPPIAEEVVQYEPWQLRRLDVLPGITCLWQISGRSRIGFQEWMRLDLEYIKHRSFWLDLKILIRTIPAVLSREGAY